MNELFKLPKQLPKSPGKIPMFRATRFSSMSSRDEKYQAALARRLRAAQRSFGISGEPTFEGARLVLRSENESLEIYQPSDSLWWTNHGLAYQEKIPVGARLPDEARARKLSSALLEGHNIDIALASVRSVTFVEADVQERNAKPHSVRTAIDINYGFALADHPVMGPGAKIKVTFTCDDTPTQLIYFWRVPAKAPAAGAISVTTALERFMRDPAFFRLRNKEASVEIHKVTFGYYAMTPTEFQRMYVPVWAIDVTCQTRELRHDFRRYVVAVDKSPEDAKLADAVANPRVCRMF